MAQIIPGNAFILIGILPSLADLEIARLLGWYRIPLKSAPKIIDVDYFAFYQGANFGSNHRWRIDFFAEYRGHELTTRRELLRDQPDHPRANEEYIKVQIAPLTQLANPIVAGSWKRITFFYTVGDLFNKAKSIHDLVLPLDERAALWKTLRERARNSAVYHTGTMPDETLTPEVLNLLLGLNSAIPDHELDNY